jgi:plastocyanin
LRKRASLFLALGLLAASAVVPGGSALANHGGNVTIQVAESLQGVPGETLRFLAPYTIRVHRGDTVTFDVHNGHSAGLLPDDVGAQDWLDENWYSSTGTYSPAIEDDEAGEIIDNFPMIDQPSDATCGNTGEPACDYNGSSFVYSGSIFGQPPPPDGQEPPESFTFATTIDAPPGSRIWVVNLVFPGQRMKIQVVNNNEATTTQADIDTARAQQLAFDQEWADAMHAKMKNKRSSHVAQDGTRVWDAWAGIDNEHASLNQFYPRNLKVKKGQRVRWHFSQDLNQIHTVSMPFPAIFNEPFEFFGTFECDSPSAPDAAAPPPASEQEEPTCPEGTTLEFEFGPFLTGAGNGTWSGPNDVEHSGFRGADLQHLSPPLHYKDPYTVRMNKKTGKQPMTYVCAIHENMFGNVRVTD